MQLIISYIKDSRRYLSLRLDKVVGAGKEFSSLEGDTITHGVDPLHDIHLL